MRSVRVKHVEVRGRIGGWFRRRHWTGFTLPVPFFGAVVFFWLLQSETVNPYTAFHEAVHVEQIRELGTVRFGLAYAWELIRHGYRGNRFEVQAYQATDAKARIDAGLAPQPTTPLAIVRDRGKA